jgi:hypothetical protein
MSNRIDLSHSIAYQAKMSSKAQETLQIQGNSINELIRVAGNVSASPPPLVGRLVNLVT